jgi:hypothetical protein
MLDEPGRALEQVRQAETHQNRHDNSNVLIQVHVRFCGRKVMGPLPLFTVQRGEKSFNTFQGDPALGELVHQVSDWCSGVARHSDRDWSCPGGTAR